MSKKSRRAERDTLIEDSTEFVGAVVGRLVKSMHLPSHMYDEFLSAGYLGLVEAAEKFDKSIGAGFRTYAALRIRGAVIDSIRNTSAISGKAYRHFQRAEALDNLREGWHHDRQSEKRNEQKTDRETRLARVLDFAARGALVYRLSVADCEDEISELQDSTIDPESRLSRAQEMKKIRSLVETLPKKERLVIKRFYFSNKSISEIAHEKKNMSKSWVSKLHQRGLKLVKDKYLEMETPPGGNADGAAVRPKRLPGANRARTGRKRSQSSVEQASRNRNRVAENPGA